MIVYRKTAAELHLLTRLYGSAIVRTLCWGAIAALQTGLLYLDPDHVRWGGRQRGAPAGCRCLLGRYFASTRLAARLHRRLATRGCPHLTPAPAHLQASTWYEGGRVPAYAVFATSVALLVIFRQNAGKAAC